MRHTPVACPAATCRFALDLAAEANLNDFAEPVAACSVSTLFRQRALPRRIYVSPRYSQNSTCPFFSRAMRASLARTCAQHLVLIAHQ